MLLFCHQIPTQRVPLTVTRLPSSSVASRPPSPISHVRYSLVVAQKQLPLFHSFSLRKNRHQLLPTYHTYNPKRKCPFTTLKMYGIADPNDEAEAAVVEETTLLEKEEDTGSSKEEKEVRNGDERDNMKLLPTECWEEERKKLEGVFLKKVDEILSLQILLAFLISTALLFSLYFTPIKSFLPILEKYDFVIRCMILTASMICSGLIMLSKKRHALNSTFLGLFTVCWSFILPALLFSNGAKIGLLSSIAALLLFKASTAFGFWVYKERKDISFIRKVSFPFVIAYCVLFVFMSFKPLSPMLQIFYAGCGVLWSCRMTIDFTSEIFQMFLYDEYAAASIMMIFLLSFLSLDAMILLSNLKGKTLLV